MQASVFGATFSPRDSHMVRSRAPAIPNQGTFSARDARDVARSLPPYISSTKSRIEAGALAAGYTPDYDRPGILPRAIHALNNRSTPSNLGARVAREQGMNAVMHAFHGVAGLNGGGCTSTGAAVTQGVLAAGGSTLTTLGAGMIQPTTLTSPTGSTMQVPNTQEATGTKLAIAGAAVSLISGIYTGVCTARTGTVPPAVTSGSQAGEAVAQIVQGVQAARTGAAASSAPAAQAAAQAATDPNSAAAAAAAFQQPREDRTLLYAGLGVAALIGVALVMRK